MMNSSCLVPSEDSPENNGPPSNAGVSNGHGNNTQHDDAAKDLEAGVIENGHPPIEDFSKVSNSFEDTVVFESAFDSAAFESAFNANFESKFEDIMASKLASSAFESAFDAKFKSKFSPAFVKAYEEEEKKEEGEGKYPRDCYSFIALGPRGKKYIIPFFFGCTVFLLQVSLLAFILFSKTYFFTKSWKVLSQNEEIDNPDQSRDVYNGGSFIPANASVIVRATQFVSVLAYVLVGGDSLSDFTKAVMNFPRTTKSGHFWLQVACIFRGLQGLLACVTAMLLVVTDNDVVGIVLNFAAIHFISSFDDTAYQLAESGYYGKSLKNATEKIKEKDLPTCILRSFNPICSELVYLLAVGTLGIVLVAIVVLVTVYGERHDVWITQLLRVEFGDETGAQQYSGCFKLTDIEHSRRMAYQSYSLRDNLTASLGYCLKTRSWVFHKEDPKTDPCELSNNTMEISHSSKTSSFDIFTSSESPWFSVRDKPVAVDFIENEQNSASEDFFSCSAHVRDGICNEELNSFEYEYDGGDCCATSCSQNELCGKGSVIFESAFGEKNVTGYGFPFTCEDPNVFDGKEVVPVEIHLDRIVELGNRTGATQIPYLTLSCDMDGDQVTFFSIPLDKSMEGKTQAIELNTGLQCRLEIEVKNNETGQRDLEIDSESFFDIMYRAFPVLEQHISSTNDADIGVNWNMGVYTGQTDTKKDFRVYKGYTKSSTEFDFTSLYMYGTIPTEIGLFSSLKSMTLGWDSFVEGSIPSEIGLLTTLTNIDFADNDIDGKIPVEIGYLTLADTINFNSNYLQGSIISEIGYLTSLVYLNLRNNLFYGPIPSEVGLLTSLRALNFAENRISEKIPTEIGFLTDATIIELNKNKLEGSILTEIGLLTSLDYLDLAHNFLTGEIPTEIGLLTELTSLIIDDNDLKGTFPSEILSLTSLTKFNASENQFQGTIPSEIGLMTSLTQLSLWINNFTGTIPTEVGLLTNLKTLFFGESNLTGTIPTEIGLLTSLKNLGLMKNALTGPIPTELGQLTSLVKLNLRDNYLTGKVPCEVKFAVNLLRKENIEGERYPQKNGTLLPVSDDCA